MAELGAVKVRIEADSSGLESGMKRATTSLKRGASELRQSANQFAKWGAAAAAAAAVAGAAIYKATSRSIDQLAKTSDRLGIATERLSELRFAAEQTGVAANTLDMGLQRMTRRISEAAQGAGEAKDAIKELGLDAQALARMSPDEQFRAIAEAMQGVSNQGDRVRLAMRLFDSEGVALVNTLKGGTEALDAFSEEAQQLGISISRVDAAKVEAANDALNKIQVAISGKMQQAVVGLAPHIEAVSELIVDMLNSFVLGSDNVDAFADNAARSLISFYVSVDNALSVVKEGLDSIWEGYQSLPPWAQEIGIAGAVVGGKKGVAFLALLGKAMDDTKVTAEWFRAFSEGDVSFMDWVTTGASEARKRLQELGREVGQTDSEEGGGGFSIIESLFGGEDKEKKMDEKAQELYDAYKSTVEANKARFQELTAGVFDAPAAGAEGETSTTPQTADDIRKQTEERLKAFQERYASEAELSLQQYQTDAEMLVQAKNQELITQEQFQAAIEQSYADHEQRLSDIKKREEQARLNMAKSTFDNLAMLMNTNSKKMFKIGKAAAIASSIIDTYQAITKTMAATPYPWNIPLATAQAAAGFAQVQNIKKQQFGQAGNPTTFVGGQPAVRTTSAGTGGAQGGGQGGTQNVNINLVGQSFGRDQVLSMIGAINEAVGDGVVLNTGG